MDKIMKWEYNWQIHRSCFTVYLSWSLEWDSKIIFSYKQHLLTKTSIFPRRSPLKPAVCFWSEPRCFCFTARLNATGCITQILISASCKGGGVFSHHPLRCRVVQKRSVEFLECKTLSWNVIQTESVLCRRMNVFVCVCDLCWHFKNQVSLFNY